MKNYILILGATIFLSGCGAVMAFDQMTNMNDMQTSKTAYKKCLADHAGNQKYCLAEKSAFAADVNAFKGHNYKVDMNDN